MIITQYIKCYNGAVQRSSKACLTQPGRGYQDMPTRERKAGAKSGRQVQLTGEEGRG